MEFHVDVVAASRGQNFSADFAGLRFTAARSCRRRLGCRQTADVSLMDHLLRTHDFGLNLIHQRRHYDFGMLMGGNAMQKSYQTISDA